MNKERAREEIIATRKTYADKKQKLEEKNEFEKSELKRRENKSFIHLYDNKIKALDIAIESLDENERLKKERDYILEKAKAELKDNEWVDVRDRLPKESGWYWVTRKFDFKGEFEYQNETDYEVDKEWFDSTKNEFDFTHKYIIAWRTYEPQPYERKE